MLSIVIPTYNYATVSLVKEIHEQCTSAGIIFEIIVQDDASTNLELAAVNQEINSIPNCIFKVNNSNLGRAKNINSLLQSANYKWVLLLDCDTIPTTKSFITNYLKVIYENKNAITFGGIRYLENPPKKNEILRWKYGKKREAIVSNKRAQKPYSFLLTSNILCDKNLFTTIKFNEKITEYGYEDLVFSKQLETNKIRINHIENPVFHLNYETSECFLEKTKKSLQTLLYLEKNNLLDCKTTRLQRANQFIITLKMEMLFLWFYKKWEPKMKNNLLSNNPKLILLDLYKLGYFISLKAMSPNNPSK